MKEHTAHLALLGIAALVILIYLMRRKPAQAAQAAVVATDNAGASPSYPNSQPIKLGDVNIGGNPLSITYNQSEAGAGQLPSERVGDTQGGCCDTESLCGTAGILQTVQNVPTKVLASAAKNFASFEKKALKTSTPPMAWSGAGAVNY